HAPGERVAAAAGDPGVHEGVQDAAFGLAEARHDRHRESREHLPPAAAVHAPRHLVPEALLGLAGDGDAALPRVLAEALDVPGDQAGPLRLGRLRRGRRLGQAADHADLVTVQHHVGRALEPGFGEPSGEPAAQLLRRFARMHVIKITTLTRTAPAPTA